MIFKTITDDITGVNKSIGLFGLSLKDVEDKLYDIQTKGFRNTFFNTSTIDVSAIERYNLLLERNYDAQKALEIASKGTNSATIALMESANGTAISTQQLTTAQKASTVAAKAQSAAYKAVSIAANMIAYALIAKGIQLAADAIDHYVNRAKYAAEAMEEAQQKIDDAQNSLKIMSDTLSENKDRFIELSQGVDEFSKNLSLSEEDYAEYLSISQKLADTAPSLVVGYDEQGNALLNIGSNAEETNQKLNELLETQQKLSKQTLVDNLDDVAKGVYYEVEETKGAITQLQQEIADTKKEASEINFDIADIVKNGNGIFQFTDVNDPLREYRNTFIKALESANIGWEDLGNDQIFVNDFSKAANNGGKDGYAVRDIALKEAQDYYNAMLNLEDNVHSASITGLEKELAEKEKAVQNSYSKMTANLQAWAEQNYNYQYLSDNTQSLVDALIPKIDWNNLGIDLFSGEDYQNYINDNILIPLMSVKPEDKARVEQLFAELLSFEDGDLNVLPFAEQLQSELEKLGIKIDVTPIISNEQEVKDRLQNSIENIAKGTDYFTSSGNQVNANDYQKLQEYTKDFSAEQVELWNNATLGAKNATDAINKYEEALNSASDSDEMSDLYATISSSVQQIATQLEPQFAKLGEAYKAIFTDDGFTLDDVDNSMLEGLRKSFAEIEKEVGVAFDSTKLNSFFDAITDGNSSAEQVQQAFNDLATAYFYNTDTLAQLNEETAASIEKQLEELGVVNAKEVVYDALNAKTEALALQEQFLAQTGIELANASNDKVIGFLNEAGASETAKAYLFQLITAEQVFNNQDLSVQEKIDKLKELANAYGQTAIAARIANLEKANEDGHIPIDYDKELASLQNDINNAVNNVKIDFKGIDTSGAKSAGSKAGKDYKDALEDELRDLDSVISGITGKIDSQISSINDQKSAALDALDAEKDALEEAKDAAVEALEAERDARLEVIEAQKEQLEEQIKLIDKQIDAKQDIIDGIQDEIDAMREANEERKRQQDLMLAQYNLQKMLSQRTKLVKYMPDTIVI